MHYQNILKENFVIRIYCASLRQSFIFQTCILLYECTGRASILPPTSALELAAASALAKSYSFYVEVFLCHAQGTNRQAILSEDRSYL